MFQHYTGCTNINMKDHFFYSREPLPVLFYFLLSSFYFLKLLEILGGLVPAWQAKCTLMVSPVFLLCSTSIWVQAATQKALSCPPSSHFRAVNSSCLPCTRASTLWINYKFGVFFSTNFQHQAPFADSSEFLPNI